MLFLFKPKSSWCHVFWIDMKKAKNLHNNVFRYETEKEGEEHEELY